MPVEWTLNPPSPCVDDSVVLVFRGYFPIWDQGSSRDPFFVSARDSFARAAPGNDGTIVLRTVYRPDRATGAEGTFGVPVGIGRLPIGSHTRTIEHHRLVQMLDGSLDSTIVETSLTFDVAATCPSPVVPMAQLPWTDSATLTPSDPCPWKPMVLTVRGRFNNSCPRVLLAAPEDSAHGRVVIRLLPNFRNPGCFDNTPPWSATIALGLPAPGTHHIEVAFLQQGIHYRWPPEPPLRRTGVMDVQVPPTCGSLPARSPLPGVTGIGAFDAGDCDGQSPEGPGIPIAIRGLFPNGCRQIRAIDQLPNPLGASLPPVVRLTMNDESCDGISCIERESPWCVETRLPSLPAGRYALMVQVLSPECLGGGLAMDAYTLDVPRPPASAVGDDGTVGVGPSPMAVSFALSGAVPNPSSGMVGFRLTLSEGGQVTAAIYDLSGRLVRTLHQGRIEPGTRSLGWDGRDGHGASTPGGVYFLRVAAHGGTAWRRIVRLRGRE
jgi:hypothetical protein